MNSSEQAPRALSGIASLSGRRVLVTGADGFIGSHLTERLVELGAEVRALCMYNSNGSLGWLDEAAPTVRGAIDAVLADVRDPRLVSSAVSGIDTVFHLAALIAIPYSYEAPRSYVDTNVVGTLNVLEAAREQGVRRVVHTSTSEVYGTPDVVPITVDHPLRAQSPYAATKIAADKLCEAYAASFETPVVVLRPFNTYGPRQSLRAVIPTVLAQLLSGTSHLEIGNLDPRRDFTYVADTVAGFVAAATAPLERGETLQLGTGQAVSIGELVDLCAEVTGCEAPVRVDPSRVRPAGSEVEVLLSDPRHAGERLGWRAEVPLRRGIEELARWLEPRLSDVEARRYYR